MDDEDYDEIGDQFEQYCAERGLIDEGEFVNGVDENTIADVIVDFVDDYGYSPRVQWFLLNVLGTGGMTAG